MKRGSRKKRSSSGSLPDKVHREAQTPGQRFITLCAGIVLAAGLLSGGVQFANDTRVAFLWAHQEQIPPVLDQQLAAIRRVAPEGSRFIWVNRTPEHWFSRIWQRLLYPDPLFIVENESDLDTTFVRWVDEYDIRFVFSAGDPPIDPGFAWRVRMSPPPGAPGEIWFGELRTKPVDEKSGQSAIREPLP